MKKTVWQICVAIVVIIALLCFFVLFPLFKVDPFLFHSPYTLWLGILITALLVIVTFYAQKYFPFKEKEE